MPCDDDKSDWKGCLNVVNIAARVAAMALAVASAAVMVTASQCTVVLPNGAEAHTVTYSDFGPFVYLVVANFIAAGMVGVAICLSVWKKGSSKPSRVLVLLLDVAAPALLYSSTGAAFATIEYISYCSPYGRGRISVCDGTVRGTNNFCSQVHKAMYISLAAAGVVSAAELVKNLTLSFGGSGSDSDSDVGCENGCHHKH